MQSRGIEKKSYERKKAKKIISEFCLLIIIKRATLKMQYLYRKLFKKKTNKTFMWKEPMKEKDLFNAVHEGKKPYICYICHMYLSKF